MAKSSAARRGRPKGSANRITNEAKRAILMAFDKLGGVERLVEWVKEDKANEFAFYTKILPKLLPRPAIDTVPEPEAPAPFTGPFTWKTPDWAKKLEKAQRRSGIAHVADLTASPGSRGGGGRPPGDGEEE